jgi:O-antigen/teichoic acid export membrane protein
MRATRRPILWLFAGRVGGTVATMAIPMVLARVLDPSDFGIYRQLFLLFATLYAIGQAGMAECLYYFVPRERGDGGRFSANSLSALAVAGLVTSVLLVIAAHPVAALLGSPIDRFVPALAAFLFFMLTSAVLEIVLVSEQRHRTAAAAYFASDLLRAGFLLVPVLLLGGIGALLAGAVVFSALRLAVTVIVLARRYGRGLRPERRLLGRQLAYALPFAAAVVVDTLQGQLHLYVVSNRFAAATFAIYSVACFQVPLVDYLVTSVGNVLMVQLGRAGEPAAPIELWRQATSRLALALVPVVAWLVIAGRDVIALLFSARYASAGGLFILASTGILLATLPTDAALRAFAETRFLFAMNVAKLVLVAATLPLLLAWLGLAGAVASTLVAGVIAKAIAVARVRRRLGVSLRALVPGRAFGAIFVAAVAAAVVAVVAVRAAAPARVLVRLALSGSVFFVVYALLAAGLGILPGLRVQATRERNLVQCAASQES